MLSLGNNLILKEELDDFRMEGIKKRGLGEEGYE